MKWVGPKGWNVELIQLDGRPAFRARRHDMLVDYCRTVTELEAVLAKAGLTTADLAEVLPAGARSTRPPSVR